MVPTLVECTYPPPPFVSLQLLCGSARRQQISVLLVCLSPPRVPTVAYVTQAEVQGTPYR